MVLFGPKIDVISKKKKSSVFAKILTVLFAEFKWSKKKGLRQNFNGFSGRIQVISKKKRSSPKLRRFFRQKLGDLQMT